MIMYLSTKGQVTIPQAVRDQARIGPGSAVDITYEEGRILLRPDPTRAAPTRGHQALEALRRAHGKVGMSTEELMALTRGWNEPDA